MKIRRYLGNNTQEAMLKVKMDLGNDAVILNTRKVRQKGLFSFFAKPMVEVLAAVDDDSEPKKEKNAVKRDSRQQSVQEAYINSRVNAGSKPEAKEDKMIQLELKVGSLETMLQKIYDMMQSPDAPKKSTGSIRFEEDRSQEFSKILQLFYNNLIKNEVEPEIARNIVIEASEKMGDTQGDCVNTTVSVLYNIISGMLGKPETIKLREDGKPTVIIFVGPTGAGKTTTLAKIAANYSLNLKKTVGFITADTYRVAAVEQLKTYAEILGMPVTVTYSANEVKEAIDSYRDKDLILIDTAGRSHRNKSQFEELKALVLAACADEVFLILNTTLSARNCRDIIGNYNFLDNYKLLFTKMDETPAAGVVLNSKLLTNKNISYVTTGQSVPDDIEIANVDKITKNLLGSIT